MQRPPATNAWLAYCEPDPRAHVRLFCFPFAGGGASVYRNWLRKFAAGIDVCPVQIPGRETRLREPPLDSLPALIDGLTEGLRPYLDVPFVFFGHSMGALLSFELARSVRRLGSPLPLHVFASGTRAPQLPRNDRPRHTLSDDDFMAELRTLSGTPEAVLQNAELMRFLLPTLRADFALFDTYTYQPEPPLTMPLWALGGREDPDVAEPDLAAWQEQTQGNFSLRMFPGNHFFVQTQQQQVLELVGHEMLRLLYRLQGGVGK